MTFRMSVYLAVCILLVMESLLPYESTQTLGTENFGGWAKQTNNKIQTMSSHWLANKSIST